FLALGLLAGGLLPGRFLARGFLPRRLGLGGLLRGQFPRRLFLGQALLLQALALELLLALGLLLGGQLFLGGAARGLALGGGDRVPEAVDGRIGRVGLLDQSQQALGLGEVAAVAALLGEIGRASWRARVGVSG